MFAWGRPLGKYWTKSNIELCLLRSHCGFAVLMNTDSGNPATLVFVPAPA